jgi:PAS domain S-box-containing protein
MDYASQDLCEMLGYTSSEIHTLFHDKYSLMVYEKDRPKFLNFVSRLASSEQTLSIQYRIVCKDGHILRINDTTTSRRMEDNKMYGFTVISDITDTPPRYILSDYATLTGQLINTYGFIQCTCEKYPKITHMNQHMEDLVTASDAPANWMDFVRENIFFMIPMGERDYLKDRLEYALHESKPIHLEHQILRSDGSKKMLNGWVSVIENEYGENEYAMIYTNTDECADALPSSRENTYLRAIKNAYQLIFELNLTNQTVECIHGRETSDIGTLSDINMTIQSAKNFWLKNYIMEEDRPMMEDYLKQITTPNTQWNESNVLQTEFRVRWRQNRIDHFIGVSVQLDSSTVLFCCRDITDLNGHNKERVTLDKLNYWTDHFMTRRDSSIIGTMLVEETGGEHTLLYVSKNITDFLGVNQNDYFRYTAGELSSREYMDIAGITYENYMKLIRTDKVHMECEPADGGSARKFLLTHSAYKHENRTLHRIFVYNDPTETSKKADASQNEKIKNEKTDTPSRNQIFVRTFGHFDLFVDNIAVTFSSSKEKELMALLIDRNGGTLSTSEAVGYLWESEAPTKQVSARYRKLAMGLKNTLVKYGIEHILINNNGVRSINTSALVCDYYELLAGNKKYRDSFHNAYMSDYSWAEETLATLWDYS